MKILTKEHILTLHKALIEEYGGTPELKDEGLLDSAISTPFQTFGGADLYPTIVDKACRLGYGLIKNHPFVDGNNASARTPCLFFLKQTKFLLNMRMKN